MQYLNFWIKHSTSAQWSFPISNVWIVFSNSTSKYQIYHLMVTIKQTFGYPLIIEICLQSTYSVHLFIFWKYSSYFLYRPLFGLLDNIRTTYNKNLLIELSNLYMICNRFLSWSILPYPLKGVAAMWQIGTFFRSDLLKKKCENFFSYFLSSIKVFILANV